MEKMIARCGLICSECEAYLATQNDDAAERQRLAEVWSRQFQSEIKPEDINCDGCLTESGRQIGYCAMCEIRKCAQERRVENCAHCDDYACETLVAFFGQSSDSKAKATLDEIRAQI